MPTPKEEQIPYPHPRANDPEFLQESLAEMLAAWREDLELLGRGPDDSDQPDEPPTQR